MVHWHWHRSKKSKKNQQPQNIEQQVQMTQEDHNNHQQSPQKTESTQVQTDYPVQPQPFITPQNRPVYANSPFYVQGQPNTVYYVVQQPSPYSLYSPYSPYYQQPQYMYQNPYYQDPYDRHMSNCMKTALVFATAFLLGDLLF